MQVKRLLAVCCSLTAVLLVLSGCSAFKNAEGSDTAASYIEDISEANTAPYIKLNNNYPEFSESERLIGSSSGISGYENYSELDSLGRCGVATALCGKELMPTEERGAIGMIKPSGWHTVKYDCVDGKYLYNRCHLIGWQLTGENANPLNLITGTRYLNVEGMLPFENMIADYIKETENHVLYRVTPDFQGNELVARGVQLEAWSVEDSGDGICFNVYAYNIQPGIKIDYQTGDSLLSGSEADEAVSPSGASGEAEHYAVNISSKKFHRTDCPNIKNIKPENYEERYCLRDELVNNGYSPCGSCKP